MPPYNNCIQRKLAIAFTLTVIKFFPPTVVRTIMQGLKQSFFWFVTRFQAIQKVSFIAANRGQILLKFGTFESEAEYENHAWFGADLVIADDPRNDAIVSLHHVVLKGLRDVSLYLGGRG